MLSEILTLKISLFPPADKAAELTETELELKGEGGGLPSNIGLLLLLPLLLRLRGFPIEYVPAIPKADREFIF